MVSKTLSFLFSEKSIENFPSDGFGCIEKIVGVNFETPAQISKMIVTVSPEEHPLVSVTVTE